MSAHCRKAGCEKTWSRDPCLEVDCPKCVASVDQRCHRPSGWSGPFVDYHRDRDLLALRKGAYGECPLGKCPDSLADLDLDESSTSNKTGAGTSQTTQTDLDACESFVIPQDGGGVVGDIRNNTKRAG